MDRPRGRSRLLERRPLVAATVLVFCIASLFPATIFAVALGGPAGAIAIPLVLWLLALPLLGLLLLVAALLNRTAADGTRLLVATLALPAAFLLADRVDRAGWEVFVAANQVEMDALAEETLREAAVLETRLPRKLDAIGAFYTEGLDAELGERFGERWKELGLAGMRVEGGTVRVTWSPGWTSAQFVYVPPGTRPGDGQGCANPEPRPLGGYWYRYSCPGGDANPD
jgi:hypothetical protein